MEAKKEAAAKKKEIQEENRNTKRKPVKIDMAKMKPKKSAVLVILQQKQKQKEANWQCDGCGGFYFDSDNPKYQEDWVSCVECHKLHFHNGVVTSEAYSLEGGRSK